MPIIKYRWLVKLGRHKLFLIFSLNIGITLIYGAKHIYYNPSKSEPIGYYWVDFGNQSYHDGDKVLLCLKQESIVARLHKLGLPYNFNACYNHTPYLLKTVAASYPDSIVINNSGIYTNNQLITKNRGYSIFKGARLLPILKLTQTLKSREYFVLGDTPTSYDSRYFGIIQESQIKARAHFIRFPQLHW